MKDIKNLLPDFQGAFALIDLWSALSLELAQSKKFAKDAQDTSNFVSAIIKNAEARLKGLEEGRISATELKAWAQILYDDLLELHRLCLKGFAELHPSKWSLSWLFKSHDPFKEFRLHADKVAFNHNLEWTRG